MSTDEKPLTRTQYNEAVLDLFARDMGALLVERGPDGEMTGFQSIGEDGRTYIFFVKRDVFGRPDRIELVP